MDIILPHELYSIYERLLIADVCQQLPGKFIGNFEAPSDEDLSRLISWASKLAFEDDPEAKTIAYEVASRIAEIRKDLDSNLPLAASIILARLGNFPGRKLLHSRYLINEPKLERIPFYLSTEVVAREMENTVEAADGLQIPLTDFQFELYETIANNNAASVSAPTSAGKSFILSLGIIKKLKSSLPASIAFIVPTRALIRQVLLGISHDLGRAGLSDIPIRCVPFPLARESAPSGVVYVLTQERLISLLQSDEAEPWLTTLIIDEAQGIKDGSRGILLHSAIDSVLKRFPNVQLYFTSPMSRNPEYLLYLFEKRTSGSFLRESHSPVSQNLLLVSEVKNRPKQVHFSLLVSNKRLDLGICEIPFKFRDGKLERRANFANAITMADDCTIIYANIPTETEKLAHVLVGILKEENELDSEIKEFIDFLKEHIHDEYPLIETLKSRVAYHYGFMPSIVRARVEDLFQATKLRFICCTSTLLQGVNLPARNIVIENPRSGKTTIMNRTDFLNLAGRAGRLSKEFHGNVWCIDANKWDTPEGSDKPCFEGDVLQDIKAAFPTVLSDGGTLIQEAIKGTITDDKMKAFGIAALGKVYSEFIREGNTQALTEYATLENEKVLEQTIELCAQMSVQLPTHVLMRNSTLHPLRLQDLYNSLIQELHVIDWIPLLPYEAGFYDRMKAIFKLLESRLEEVDTATNFSYLFDAWLASKWIHDTPIKGIINERINYLKEKNKFKKARDTIYEILEALEKRIRFRYVRNMRAYNDVLALALEKRGHPQLVEQIRPLHLYLECGASDRVVLSLIAIGLSRTTALLVKGSVHLPEDATPEKCLELLNKIDIEKLSLPGLCKQEIKSIRRVS